MEYQSKRIKGLFANFRNDSTVSTDSLLRIAALYIDQCEDEIKIFRAAEKRIKEIEDMVGLVHA